MSSYVEQINVEHTARMLHSIALQMDIISEYMLQNDLNLDKYPQGWQSFDEMADALRAVFVYALDDDSISKQVGEA